MNLHTIRSFDTKRHEQFMAMVYFACLLVLFFAPAAVKAQEPAPPPIPKLEPTNSLAKVPAPPTRTQKVVQQGIAIEFTVDPSAKDGTKVRAGEDTNIEFKVTDTTSGTPVKGLNLSAWLSLREGEKAAEGAQCHEKIQSYLTGSMRARPDVEGGQANSVSKSTGVSAGISRRRVFSTCSRCSTIRAQAVSASRASRASTIAVCSWCGQAGVPGAS